MIPADTVSLGEGNTPLINLPRLARSWNLRALWAKAEFMNPTGSYKDRIAAASMRHALRQGCRGWIATSSGNGGAAMSAYGSRVRLPGVICVTADAPAEKLATIRPYQVLMVAMSELGPDVMAELGRIAAAEQLLLTITAHAYNPVGMRGAAAIGRELAAAIGGARTTAGDAPDSTGARITQVYVPSGGGGLLAAVAGGLTDTGRTVPVVCAQPLGCGPIARHLLSQLPVPRVDVCTTRISGLQLAVPPDGQLAASAVRDSGGWGVLVDDADAWRAQSALAQQEGIFVEPAAAVALQAVRQDAEAGRIGPADEPCVILTGHGMKDLSRFTASIPQADVIGIDAVADRVGSHFSEGRWDA